MALLRQTGIVLSLAAMLAAGCVAPSPPAPPGPAPPSSAQAGDQTIVAIQPAAPAHPTLPEFLGINALFGAIGGLHQYKLQLISMFFPQLQSAMAVLEPPPPILPITDPANLGEDAPPVVQAAAEAQAEENAAPQKIKAIEALGRIGCVKGRPVVEQGLLAALDDPTERVRYATVKVLADLGGSPCRVCKSGSCCSPKIYKRLERMVNKQDALGCYEEPSERVRRLARLAMRNCQPLPPQPVEERRHIEGPPRGAEPPPPRLEGPPMPMPPEPNVTAKSKEKPTKSAGLPQLEPPKPTIADARTPKYEDRADDTKPSAVVQAKNETETEPKTEPKPVAKKVARKSKPNKQQPKKAEPKKAEPKKAEPKLTPVKNGVLWESVSAPFENFDTRSQAWAAMVYFRKRALRIEASPPPGFARKNLEVQPKRWSRWEAFPQGKLRRMLKTLPLGQISPVLTGNNSYVIVRVLNRTRTRTKKKPKPVIQQAVRTFPEKESVKPTGRVPWKTQSQAKRSQPRAKVFPAQPERKPTKVFPVTSNAGTIVPPAEKREPASKSGDGSYGKPPVSNNEPWDLGEAGRSSRSRRSRIEPMPRTAPRIDSGVIHAGYERPARRTAPAVSEHPPTTPRIRVSYSRKFYPPIQTERGKRPSRQEDSEQFAERRPATDGRPSTNSASTNSPSSKPNATRQKSWLDEDFGTWSNKKTKR